MTDSRRDFTIGNGRVVVGVSGSLRNVGAVVVAERLARRLCMPLIAVSVWQPYGGEIAARRMPAPTLDAHYRDRARDILSDALNGLQPGIDAEAWVVCGMPGPALVRTADQADDLLVIGRSRHNLLARAFTGGIGRYCIQHARCPVVAVPEPDLVRQTGRLPRRLPGRRRVASH